MSSDPAAIHTTIPIGDAAHGTTIPTDVGTRIPIGGAAVGTTITIGDATVGTAIVGGCNVGFVCDPILGTVRRVGDVDALEHPAKRDVDIMHFRIVAKTEHVQPPLLPTNLLSSAAAVCSATAPVASDTSVLISNNSLFINRKVRSLIYSCSIYARSSFDKCAIYVRYLLGRYSIMLR